MRLEVAAFLVAAVSLADAKSFKLDLPSATVTSVSVAGRKLLSQARRLPEEEEQQYNNYNDRNNQNWRYSQAQSEYAQQYKSNNQQQYQQYQNQNQNQQQNNQDDDDGYHYSGYSSNAQSNVGDYMSNVRYYTGTRDSNWHFNSGRTYNDAYGYGYGQNNMGSYRNGGYDQGAYSAYNGMSGSWGSEGSADTSWMSDYSVKFDGCVSDYHKDSGETNTQLLAKFKLCPNSSGTSCRHGGDYVIPMEYFVEAYETIATTDESCSVQQGLCGSQCGGYNRKLQYSAYGSAYSNYGNANNNAYGNANNQNGNNAYAYSNANQDNGEYDDQAEYDDGSNESACFEQCMESAGMGYCNDNGYGMNVREMIQCRSLDTYTDGSKPYWVGATCRDGGVFIDLFADSSCSRTVNSDSQETILGYSLPENNLVSKGLVSCTGYMRDSQYSEGGICQGLYTDAGKCERHMKGVPKKHTGGCAYIRHLNARRSVRMAGIITVIILMTACLTMAAYVYHLMRQGQDAQQAMRSIYLTGKDRMTSMMPTMPGMATGKSLSQPLAPTDDSKTVASGSSEESGGYQGAKMSAIVDKTGDV